MSAPPARAARPQPVKILTVVALLIGTMVAMLELKARVGDHVAAAVTFAAIGFVVLAAYGLAELAAMVGLPRVTGYILAGIGLGPSAASLMGIPPLLTPKNIEDMGVFKTLALALIALEAGLELSLEAMKRFRRTIAGIILFKIPLSWLFIGGTFVALTTTVLPLDGVDSIETLLAIGLVLGAISVGTSPAVSVAVISETGAKGKTADLVLGFAVFKDVVMVVMLGFAIAFGGPLATGAEFEGTIILDLIETILVSILVGVVIGYGLIAWMRWVRWENLLLLIVLAYGISPVEHWFYSSFHIHLKPLLIFIAAGFTVANFSRYGHELHKPLSMLALPVFVLFFTTAGAGLELESTIAVLPLAASLFVARLAMMYLATRFGGRLAGEERGYTDVLWLGFISQAGVALVLLGIAVESLPSIGKELSQVGFALIALNLLVGPVLLRVALRKGDAVAPAAPDGDDAPAPDRARLVDARAAIATSTVVELPPVPLLRSEHEAVARELERLREEVFAPAIAAWAESARARLDAGGRDALEPVSVEPMARTFRDGARHLRDHLIDLPNAVTAPLDKALLEGHERMGLGERVQAAFLRLAYLFGRRTRRVGARSVARARVEGRFVPAVADLLDAVALAEARRVDALDDAQRLARSRPDPGDLTGGARLLLDDAVDEANGALDAAIARALADLAEGFAFAGTPRIPARSVRYASVAGRVENAIERLDRRGPAWDEAIARVARRAQLRALLLDAERRLLHHAHENLERWGHEHRDAMLSLLDEAGRALDAGEAALEASEGPALDRVHAAIAIVDDALNSRGLKQLADLRLLSDEKGPLKVLEALTGKLVPDLPAHVQLAPTAVDLGRARVPSDIRAESTPVAATVEKYLTGELTWSLAETRAEEEEVAARLVQRLSAVAGAATVGLAAGVDELVKREGDGDAEVVKARVLRLAHDTFDRARGTITHLTADVERELADVPQSVIDSSDDAFLRVYQRLLGEAGAEEDVHDETRRQRLERRLRRVGRWFDARWTGLRGSVGSVYRRFMRSELAQKARLRSGSELWDPSHMADDLRTLQPTAKNTAGMPYVLARLLSSTALDTHHLLTGVASEVKALEEAFARFEQGVPTAVLLRGQAGLGKTSVGRVTLRGVAGRRLVDVVLDADHRTEASLCEALGARTEELNARSFKSLERALKGSGAVILLDGVEQVFTRSARGLALLRGLLRLVLATRGDVMWVVSVDEPTARLLEPLCDLPGYFTDHVSLRPLDAEQIGQLLEARCRLSGFEIQWPREAAEDPSRWRRFRRPRRSEEEQRTRFLRTLARASGGNIRDALTLFVNAIEEVDGDVVVLGPVVTAGLGWFDQLGRDAHRLLAAHVLCGTLDTGEAHETLLLPSDRLAAARARLLGAGLLVPAGRDPDRLRVQPHALRRVTDLLIERNELLGALPGRQRSTLAGGATGEEGRA
ncbi:MAG: cation:proton antiporter [Myxococcales bacterium]|nr:cation:proton antiporter [Myxococcales bacterium]MCB9731152.1 cation:proton antiporter [Deltaproteobacteria bacterium]